MERRKFLIGAGSLAAGSAAAMGTGAFTSVQANRSLTVQTAADNSALLAIEAENTPNGNQYVSGGTGDSNTVSIDISTDDGDGVNDDAYTIIRDLLSITNEGTQEVYVWFQGLPDGVRVFHDDPNFPKAENTGDPNDYTGNLSTPGTGRFQPDDPDASESNLYYKLPNLNSGDTLDNIGILIDTRGGAQVDFNDDIQVIAKTLSEAES